jgi:hypothetical protein
VVKLIFQLSSMSKKGSLKESYLGKIITLILLVVRRNWKKAIGEAISLVVEMSFAASILMSRSLALQALPLPEFVIGDAVDSVKKLGPQKVALSPYSSRPNAHELFCFHLPDDDPLTKFDPRRLPFLILSRDSLASSIVSTTLRLPSSELAKARI